MIFERAFLQQAQKEIIKLREGEEKQRRAREAREKAEAEKAARAARKRALVDMNAHETQEGVMDSLMEALQTGSAFSRPDQRRKRQTRAAGGKLYRTAYASTKSTKKEKLLLAKLYEPGEIERHAVEQTRGKAARYASSLPGDTRVVSGNSEPARYTTPEENQQVYKRLLIDRATKTPKQERYLSRVSSFKRKKQSEIACKKIRFDRPMIEETPKRDISIRLSGNFDETWNWPSGYCIRRVGSVATVASTTSYGFVIDELKKRATTAARLASPSTDHFSPCSSLPSPSLLPIVSTGEARLKFNPVKRRRVIVSKKHKRNNIVRRTVRNRRLRHRRAAGYLGSPTSGSVSLIDNPSVCRVSDTTIADIVSDTLSDRISKSMDDVAIRVDKGIISAPLQLIRTRNFHDIARWKDENENDTSIRCSNSQVARLKSPTGSPLEPSKENAMEEDQLLDVRFGRSNNALEFSSALGRTDQDASPTLPSSKRNCTDTLSSLSTFPTLPTLSKRKHRKRIWKFW